VTLGGNGWTLGDRSQAARSLKLRWSAGELEGRKVREREWRLKPFPRSPGWREDERKAIQELQERERELAQKISPTASGVRSLLPGKRVRAASSSTPLRRSWLKPGGLWRAVAIQPGCLQALSARPSVHHCSEECAFICSVEVHLGSIFLGPDPVIRTRSLADLDGHCSIAWEEDDLGRVGVGVRGRTPSSSTPACSRFRLRDRRASCPAGPVAPCRSWFGGLRMRCC